MGFAAVLLPETTRNGEKSSLIPMRTATSTDASGFVSGPVVSLKMQSPANLSFAGLCYVFRFRDRRGSGIGFFNLWYPVP